MAKRSNILAKENIVEDIAQQSNLNIKPLAISPISQGNMDPRSNASLGQYNWTLPLNPTGNPGDVLRGDMTWGVPVGITVPEYQFVNVLKVTAAQILAMDTTPIVLIPKQTNRIIVPIKNVIAFYPSTPFTIPASTFFNFEIGTQLILQVDAGSYLNSSVISDNIVSLDGLEPTLLINQDVTMSLSAAVSFGNASMSVCTSYFLLQ